MLHCLNVGLVNSHHDLAWVSVAEEKGAGSVREHGKQDDGRTLPVESEGKGSGIASARESAAVDVEEEEDLESMPELV